MIYPSIYSMLGRQRCCVGVSGQVAAGTTPYTVELGLNNSGGSTSLKEYTVVLLELVAD